MEQSIQMQNIRISENMSAWELADLLLNKPDGHFAFDEYQLFLHAVTIRLQLLPFPNVRQMPPHGSPDRLRHHQMTIPHILLPDVF